MSKLVEEWRDIKGFEGLYQVSDWGRVRNMTKWKILKFYSAGSKKEYFCIDLHKNKIVYKKYVHRLVAKTFIPNPDNKPQVDHINTNTFDNRVENLRWVTNKENMANPLTIEHRLNSPLFSTQIYQYSLDGILIAIYPSMHEAERNGYSRKEIKRCCLGIYKQHKGYKWSFNPL